MAKATNEAKDARRRLSELQRHNETMEAIALQKGKGLQFLKPYKKGLGLYMTSYVKRAKTVKRSAQPGFVRYRFSEICKSVKSALF